MKYSELKKILNSMSGEELTQDVTIYDSVVDEYIPVSSAHRATVDDVLSVGDVFLKTPSYEDGDDELTQEEFQEELRTSAWT